MARANAGGEATEKPTPRRLREARQTGQVAVSFELSRALAIAALLALMAMGIGPALARLVALFRATFATSMTGELPLAAVARTAVDAALALSLAPLLTVALTVVIASALQTRGVVAWRAVGLDLARLSPARGWARLFSARTAGDVALGVLKLAVVGAIVAASLRPLVLALPRLTAAAPGTVLLVLGTWALRLGLHVTSGLVALGVLDAAVGWWRHQRALRMTRDEVKRDQKEDQGDPRHKAERRRLQRAVPIVGEVRRAALVVVQEQPSVAIAIHYDRVSEATPVIIAKGEGALAQTIEAAARAAGVPVQADAGLARALRDIAEGDALPPALFEPVAEALRLAWGLNGSPTRDGNQA